MSGLCFWARPFCAPLAHARCTRADNNRIVTGALDSTVIVWNVAEKSKRIQIKRAHPLGVTACAFVDANTVLTAGHDATVRTWTLKD